MRSTFRAGWRRALLGTATALALGTLGLPYVRGDGGFPKDLGGDDRALLHLAVDKPMYRAGETVYLRGFLLDAFKTTLHSTAAYCQVQIKSPKGDIVVNEGIQVQNGILGYAWTVPAGQAGGEYTLVAAFPWNGYAPAETKFDIRSYRVPRLRTDLQFLRKGYGPADEVTATLSAKRAEGGIPVGAAVEGIARVDGKEIWRGAATLDATGGTSVSFKLPAEIENGDGSLALVITDGGVTETAAKTLPILLNKVAIQFFPEGGDLVPGVPCRVYLEARDTRKLPADVKGRVLDRSGAAVATFATEHEGRGLWSFTPLTGEKYVVVLDQPAGNVQRFDLPEPLPTGFTLAAATDVFPANAPVILRVGAKAGGTGKLILSRYEREIAAAPFELRAGETAAITLTPPSTAEGVLRATVVDDSGTPRAERLIFRAPARRTLVKVTANPERTTPGGKVSVTIETTDEQGKPVAALVGIAVTDQAVLEAIDKRERAPRLPVQVLLGSDVRELADAEVYLSDVPEATRAVDLLLGTQGWRRFAFRDAEAFVGRDGDAAKRALALRLAPPPAPPAGAAFAGGGFDEAEERGGRGVLLGAQEAPMPQAAAAPAPDAQPKAGEDGIVVNAPVPDPAAGADAPQAEPAAGLVAGDDAQDKNEEAGDRDALRARRPAGRLEAEKKRMAKEMAPGWVRVYAHASRDGRSPEQRNDFAETVYWNAGLATDATGKATVTFDLSDSVTTFSVRADAVNTAGGLGAGTLGVEARKPFYLEPKLPLEITAGDLIEVPVALANGTADPLEALLTAEIGPGIVREGAEPKLALRADSSGRLYLTLIAGKHNGEVAVKLIGSAGAFRDTVTRTIPVVPFGFPIEIALGGKLAGSATHAITIPDGIEPGSLVAEAVVYPSPMASLTEALAGLLQEPCGCFEQTSSTAYPNLMVMNYFKSHRVTDPQLVARAGDLLDKGYKRLVGFECKEKGYEWFGGDPGHEALTAYGVMEFSDMSGVYPVDAEMLKRTRAWLLSRRDGKGGFTRNPRALDSFGGAPDDVTNAYIVWALLNAGEKGLDAEIAAIKAAAAGATDTYVLGLAANILFLAGDAEGGRAIAAKLAAKQEQDGAVRGAATSITRSGGECLEIETTALAMMAWLAAPAQAANLEKAAGWMTERCKGGRFGSTQSTIMALKAILGYDAARATPKAPGTLHLAIDGVEIGKVGFTPETTGALRLPAFADKLTPGTHKLELTM
ncbi:MAG: A-macroglobulin complement component, partial [Planctomycetes bacterium]|nr:A-macroglobulin complement component [Planctomycetota bacterium]